MCKETYDPKTMRLKPACRYCGARNHSRAQCLRAPYPNPPRVCLLCYSTAHRLLECPELCQVPGCYHGVLAHRTREHHCAVCWAPDHVGEVCPKRCGVPGCRRTNLHRTANHRCAWCGASEHSARHCREAQSLQRGVTWA